jgi:hypothetical protein
MVGERPDYHPLQCYTDSDRVQCLAVESETAGLERET